MAPQASLEIENRWDDAHAARLSPAGLLLYRSNLLGSDKRITNFGGGNTSAKLEEKDPLTGKEVEVLWVKGSGGDLGTMKLDGLSTLYMEKFLALEKFYKDKDSDSTLVPLYAHCAFNLNPRAASIDTDLLGPGVMPGHNKIAPAPQDAAGRLHARIQMIRCGIEGVGLHALIGHRPLQLL
jgi:rhamnose utilization protein RhaD (predicted bifunctional aldolase and dehydrogenase)